MVDIQKSIKKFKKKKKVCQQETHWLEANFEIQLQNSKNSNGMSLPGWTMSPPEEMGYYMYFSIESTGYLPTSYWSRRTKWSPKQPKLLLLLLITTISTW